MWAWNDVSRTQPSSPSPPYVVLSVAKKEEEKSQAGEDNLAEADHRPLETPWFHHSVVTPPLPFCNQGGGFQGKKAAESAYAESRDPPKQSKAEKKAAAARRKKAEEERVRAANVAAKAEVAGFQPVRPTMLKRGEDSITLNLRKKGTGDIEVSPPAPPPAYTTSPPSSPPKRYPKVLKRGKDSITLNLSKKRPWG